MHLGIVFQPISAVHLPHVARLEVFSTVIASCNTVWSSYRVMFLESAHW